MQQSEGKQKRALYKYTIKEMWEKFIQYNEAYANLFSNQKQAGNVETAIRKNK